MIAGLLVAMLSAGYFVLEGLKQRAYEALEVELSKFGVSNPLFDGVSVSWLGVDIQSLSFELEKEGRRFNLALQAVSIQNSIAALQQQKIESISVEQANLTIQRLAQKPADKPGQLAASTLPIPSDFFLLFPVNSAIVHQYSVQHKQDRWRIHSENGLNVTAKELTSDFSIFHPSSPEVVIQFQLNAQNQIAVEFLPVLLQADKAVLPWGVTLSGQVIGYPPRLKVQFSTALSVAQLLALRAVDLVSVWLEPKAWAPLVDGVLDGSLGEVSIAGDVDLPLGLLANSLSVAAVDMIKGGAKLSLSLNRPDDDFSMLGDMAWEADKNQLALNVEKFTAGSAFVQQQWDTVTANDISLKGGNMQLSANMVMDVDPLLGGEHEVSSLQGKALVQFEAIDVAGQDIELSGLNTTLNLDVKGTDVAFSVDDLSLQDMTFGVTANSIKSAFSGKTHWLNKTYELNVASIEANILGGQLSLSPFLMTGPETNAAFKIYLDNIQLNDVLALQANEDLTGEGRLSGFLQTRIKDSVLEIEEGHLGSGAEGGVIRYRRSDAANAVAQSDPSQQVAFVLDAMEDFHYSSLETDVSLAAPDNLHVFVALKGANPNVEQGNDIHLNLNLEENINPLIQTLGIESLLNQKLLKQYQDNTKTIR